MMMTHSDNGDFDDDDFRDDDDAFGVLKYMIIKVILSRKRSLDISFLGKRF